MSEVEASDDPVSCHGCSTRVKSLQRLDETLEKVALQEKILVCDVDENLWPAHRHI